MQIVLATIETEQEYILVTYDKPTVEHEYKDGQFILTCKTNLRYHRQQKVKREVRDCNQPN